MATCAPRGAHGATAGSDFIPKSSGCSNQYVHRLMIGGLPRSGRAVRRQRPDRDHAARSLTPASPRRPIRQRRRELTLARRIDSPKATGKMRGYLWCAAEALRKLPGVLVGAENRAQPHIEDSPGGHRAEPYVAFAPERLTPLGGYPATKDSARGCFSPARINQRPARTSSAAVAWAPKRAEAGGSRRGRFFCYCGGITTMLANPVPRPGRRGALLTAPIRPRRCGRRSGAAPEPYERRER